MAEDAKLGEILLKESKITQAQLKTAQDFQKKVGGDLADILLKLGYVKDSVLAELKAHSQHAASAEISPTVIDLEAVKVIPRALLEKHQAVPLKGSDASVLVLAMQDPNNLQAVEEVQFLVDKMVEPAVAPKAAIRKALNQLDDLLKAAEARKAAAGPQAAPHAAHPEKPAPTAAAQQEKLKAVFGLPLDRLFRAYVLVQIEKGHISLDELLQRAEKSGS